MSVPSRVSKIVIFKSGNRCAFPDCNKKLTIDGTDEGDLDSIVGELAHIEGDKPNSARYNSSSEDNERNSPCNIIVLCNTHHKVIDDQPEKYTVEVLKDMKLRHEKWIDKQTTKELANISFLELGLVTKYLLSTVDSDAVIELIPPKEKIDKNKLSIEIENLIKMGLSRVTLVGDYIYNQPNAEFGENLKQGFIEEYERLIGEGFTGDTLFNELFDFASRGTSDFKLRAAGLSILVYYFETCDIFEK